MEHQSFKGMDRIIQETVPGKQVTLAHVIASPLQDIYDRIGVEPGGAIGILTLTPYETAIIAADIATKAADVRLGFLDRFTGSVIITGDVDAVETALREVTEVLAGKLEFDTVPVTKT